MHSDLIARQIGAASVRARIDKVIGAFYLVLGIPFNGVVFFIVLGDIDFSIIEMMIILISSIVLGASVFFFLLGRIFSSKKNNKVVYSRFGQLAILLPYLTGMLLFVLSNLNSGYEPQIVHLAMVLFAMIVFFLSGVWRRSALLTVEQIALSLAMAETELHEQDGPEEKTSPNIE